MNGRIDKSKKIVTLILSVGLLGIIAVCVGAIVVYKNSFSKTEDRMLEQIYDREYTVLIAGTSGKESFLSRVCEGALSVNSLYNTSVQFYLSANQSADYSQNKILDYAGYIGADCIITYIDDKTQSLIPPKKIDGKTIPVITLGSYNPDIPQISYIGISHSQLGAVMAEEIISVLNGKGSVFLLNTYASNDDAYSTIMNSLLNVLADKKDINITVSHSDKNISLSVEDSILQEIASLGPTDLIAALSETATIRACQSVIDLNLTGKTSIIGFGEGEDTRNYLDKGILTELISVDPYSVGKTAVGQFYEYATTGYTNSYIVSDIIVNKKGGQLDR